MTAIPGSSVLLRLLAVSGVIVAVGCSGSEAPDRDADTTAAAPSGQGDAEQGPISRSDQPRIPESQLGDLERENLTLSVPWTRGRINREAPDTTGRATLRSVGFSRTENVDRMTLVFDSAGDYPCYVVDSSLDPLPRCASADSVAVQGQGLLRVRIRNVDADEAAAGPALQSPELNNVTSVHRTCLEETAVEWVLDVQRATYYRVVQASNPPRLVVDVMQVVEESPQDGAP